MVPLFSGYQMEVSKSVETTVEVALYGDSSVNR